MKVEIRFKPADFATTLKRATRFIRNNHEQALNAAALSAIEMIDNRTTSGFDVNGNRFKRYSKAYADYRVEKGRNVYPVDLQFTGRMLNSMRAKKTSYWTRLVFFRGAENSKKAAMNNKSREFFGLNNKEQSRVADVYFKRLTK